MNRVAHKTFGWREVHLADVVDKDSPICYGIVLPGDHVDDGVPVIKVKDIAQGGVRTTGLLQTSLDIDVKYKRSRLAGGDILLSIRGTVGRLGVVPDELAGANITQDTARIRISCSETRAYVYQALQSDDLQVQIRDHVVGQAVKGINIRDVKRLKLLLPIERHAQKYIAELLRTQDTAIQKAEQLITAKERHRDALIQRLYALSDRRGNASRFRELLKESMEAGNSGRHAKKITVKLYGKGVLAKEEKRQGSEQTQYFIRRAGQLIYSKLDFLNGAFGIVPPELDGYESTLDLPAFDIASTVNPIWLLGYLTRPTYYTHQVGLARGQRKARRVHPSDLLASSLHAPPRDLQDRIAEILTSSQDDIDKSKRLLQSLKTQKRGLMQKLLTGQWRLPCAISGEEP